MGIETAIIGSALLGTYGASKQASAAERGAQMQSDAAARAAALQEKQYADLAPYRESGQLGLTKIQDTQIKTGLNSLSKMDIQTQAKGG